MISKVKTIKGKNNGKTVAVFAGIHGNESAGIMAIKMLWNNLEINAGVVHLVIANPEAVERNVRYTEKNLNRCFITNNRENSKEDIISRELMLLLDSCDALLDLHGYNGSEDQPFLICENESFDLAKRLDFSIVSSGWSDIEPGATDGYMYSQKKIAICAECGSNLSPENYTDLATDTILRFLEHLGLLNSNLPPIYIDQEHVEVSRTYKRQGSSFKFMRKFNNFDALRAGEIFATDGNRDIVAGTNECIIFPRPNAKIGDEAFIIGSIKK